MQKNCYENVSLYDLSFVTMHVDHPHQGR